MATEVLETELKYEMPPGARLPQLDDLPTVCGESEPDDQTLTADYYDTDDLRLIRSGITLRRRRGGSDAGWHLKLPAGGHTRTEIQVPLERSASSVPDELAALVLAYTRGAALRPVAQLTTQRRRRILRDSAGASLAEVVADDVHARTMGAATGVSRWQEAEVELTGGTPSLLAAADKRMRQAGLRPAGRATKLQRALGDQLTAVGSAGDEPGQAGEPTAGQVVLGYLDAQLAALKSLDPAVRRDMPDAVHQMRVATRRLRGALRVFRNVLDHEERDALAAELKWLGGVLGAARDAEVLSGHLQAAVRELPPEVVMGPVEARVRAHFAPIAAGAREEVVEALESSRYYQLLDRLDAMAGGQVLAGLADQPAAGVLTRAVRRAGRKVRRRIRRAWSLPAGPGRDLALHDTRKAAKEARYAAEAVSPVFGKPAGRFAKRMKKLQSVLGDHHDGVVARGLSRELGVRAQLAGDNAFCFGVLYQLDVDRGRQLERQARRVWKKAARSRDRRWLR
jgi:CHAD domain-containing protein